MPADPHLIENRRLIAAPRERVWAACRDPGALARWWGPQGFTNTFHAFDFRPGGAWRFTMHGPGGTAYAMDHRFTAIVPPERLEFRHHQAGHDFILTMTFAAQGDRTELTWVMRFDDPAEAAKVRSFVGPANEQNFDRLEAYLSFPVSATGPAVR
jgi:uncharacterized protein YndB with AHSA1/START domain